MSHSALRAVIFDLDDTIHDKTATLQVVARRLYSDHQLGQAGVKADEWLACFVALNQLRIEKTVVFERLQAEFDIPGSTTNELLRDFDANLGKQAQPFPGALECLAACKAAGLKVGVVTNGRDAFQRSKLEGLGALPLLDAIYTSGGFGVKKPDPTIFLACLKALGTEAREAAVVGDDRCCDIDPALALGMRAIWKSSESANDVALSSHDFQRIQALLTKAAR